MWYKPMNNKALTWQIQRNDQKQSITWYKDCF